jgi:hypothetical protein
MIRLHVSEWGVVGVPSFHVLFDFEKVFDFVAVGFAWGCFKHVASIFRVKSRDIFLGAGRVSLYSQVYGE